MYFLFTGQETLWGLRPAPLDSQLAAHAPSPKQAPRVLKDKQSPTVQVLQVASGPHRQHSFSPHVLREAARPSLTALQKWVREKKNKACAVEPEGLLTGAGPTPPQVLLKHCCLYGLAVTAHTEHV